MTSPTSNGLLPIPVAMRELREKHGTSASYQQIWTRIVAGIIPAVRGTDRRSWLIDRADLPAIAEALPRRRAAA